MAVESELIDCRVGEPHVTPEQIADVNIGTYGNKDYVLSVGNKMKAELITNNSVRVFDGVMVYGGLRDAVPVNKYYDMTIDNGAQGKNRNDIIVRRYTKEEGARGKASARFVVVKGTAVNGSAEDPKIEHADIRAGALTHDMPLHRVRIEGLNIVAVEPLFDMLTSMAEHQNMLSELNGKLADDTGWIKLEDSGAVQYRRKSGVVYISCDSGGSSCNGARALGGKEVWNVGTLPEDCRPTINMHTTGTLKNYDGYECQLRVYPDGLVEVMNLGANIATYWGASLSYPV